MNNRATFTCAVASSMKWLRAVLVRDGKVVDQLLSPFSWTVSLPTSRVWRKR